MEGAEAERRQKGAHGASRKKANPLVPCGKTGAGLRAGTGVVLGSRGFER